MTPIIQEFADFVRSWGYVPPSMVKTGHKITRFNPDNGKPDASKATWLVQFDDMRGGTIGSFTDGSAHTWQAKGVQFTEDEYKAFREENRKRQEVYENELAERRRAAATLANDTYNKATIASGSESKYLLRKCLDGFNYRVKLDQNQDLILPVRDLVSGEITSIQTTEEDGVKRFDKGGKTKGCCLLLFGTDTTQVNTVKDLAGFKRVAIVEGFATGATVMQSLGCPVVIAFSGGNMAAIAQTIRKHNQDIEIIICGDNDKSKPINAGATFATSAAFSVRGVVALASGVNGCTDFNDDYVAARIMPDGSLDNDAGLKAVRDVIERATAPTITEMENKGSANANDLPVMILRHGELNEDANAIIKAIALDGAVFAENGKRLIRLLSDGERLALNVHAVRHSAMSQVRFMTERTDKEGIKHLTKANCSNDACNMVLSIGEWAGVRVLNGVTGSSLILTDGRVIANSGYDELSGIYGLVGGCYPKIADYVSRDDALVALNTLCDLVREFDFDTAEDASAAISLLISSLLRPVMRTCPMFLVNAATYGSGKTALAQVAAIIATGKKADATPWTSKAEEVEKRLLSLALSGLPVAFFDNLMGDLHDEGGAFAAFLTSENYSGRELGQTRIVGAKTKMLMLATGNNVTPIADMARRTLTVRLTPDCENPEARTFSRDIEAFTIQHREGIIKAILTLVKGYFDAGCPVPSDMKRAGSFSDWEKLARLPLLWLGVVDPWLVVGKAQAVDPDKLALGALLEAITRRGWGSSPFLSSQVASENSFIELMPDDMKVKGEVNIRKWGRWLASKVDVIVDGLKLVKTASKKDGKSWYVVEKVKAN